MKITRTHDAPSENVKDVKMKSSELEAVRSRSDSNWPVYMQK